MTTITKNQHSNLTELQLKLLSFYREYYKTHKRWPRIVEAATYLKRHHSNISIMATTLAAKGYFEKQYDGIYKVTKKH